ncbi:MAG TPA: hypothetical protein VM282_22210 [Acidimicrobiales bacterium]|nr:hypothetical protein [Acidimicrobiales bacterium]
MIVHQLDVVLPELQRRSTADNRVQLRRTEPDLACLLTPLCEQGG